MGSRSVTSAGRPRPHWSEICWREKVGGGGPRPRAAARSVLKGKRFERAPGWEGFNNRIVPKRPPTITQDFGFSKTSLAGKAAGELGGQVWRSTTRAYYDAKIPAKTLADPAAAAGT